MKQYLLPCPCGEKTVVDAGQAGLQVDCECGARLDVPTMRGLRNLEPAETETEADEEELAASSWKPHHGVFFLGALVTLLGVGSLVMIYPDRPEVVVNSEFVRETNEQMTLLQSWVLWQDLRRGLNTSLLSESPEFLAEQQSHRVKMALAMVATFVGVALLVGGSYLVPRGSETPPAPAGKAPAE